MQLYEQRTSAVGGDAALPTRSAPQVANFSQAEALQQTGRTVSNTAATGADIFIKQKQQETKQQEQSAALWSANTMSQARLDWTTRVNKLQSEAPADGAGYSQNILDGFDKYQAEALKNAPNNASRKFLSDQMLSLKTQLGIQALEYQDKQRINYNIHQMKKTIDNGASTIGIDPTQAAPVYGTTIAAIDKMEIPPEEKFKLKEAARQDYVKSYTANQVQNNASGFQNTLAPGLGKIPQGTTTAKIANAATLNGNNPLVTLAIGQIESGINPSAVSSVKGSSSRGVFGFTDATWKQYGGTDADRGDIEKEIQIQQKLQTDNKNYLTANLGRAPQPTEEYMAHFLGAGGAVETIHAYQSNPNESMADVVRRYDPKNADKIISGNNLEGKTVGQVMNNYQLKMNSAMSKFSESEKDAAKPAFINSIMTQDERNHAMQMATSMVSQQAANNRNIYNQKASDDIAQAMNGILPTQPLTHEQFTAMYPMNSQQADMAYKKYSDAIDTGIKIKQMGSMSPEQRMQVIQAATPKEGATGYALDAENQRRLIQANQAIERQIKADPAQFVLSSNNPTITQAYQAMQANNTPENRRNYFNSIITQQQQQGIQFPSILTKSQEDQAIQSIANLKGIQKANAVSALAQQYGEYYPLVARQLQNNSSFPAGTSAMLSAPTQYAREQAAIAADLDKATLEKGLNSDNKKDADDRIAIALEPYINSLTQVQQGSKSVSDIQTTIQKLVYSKVSMGVSPADAADSTVKMFVGDDKYQYVENRVSNSQLRIPKDLDKKVIEKGSEQVISNLNINNVDLSNTKALKNPWYMTDNIDGYLNQIKKNSMWLTNEDNQGATLYFLGRDNNVYPVLDKATQKPITKAWADMMTTTKEGT